MADELALSSTGKLTFEDEQVKFNGVAVHLTATQRKILSQLAASGEAGLDSASLAAKVRPSRSPKYRDTLKSHIWLLRRKLGNLPPPRLEIVGGSGKSFYRLGWSQERTDSAQ